MAVVKLNLSGHDNPALKAQGFNTYKLQVDLADPNLPNKVVEFLSPLVSSADVVHVALPGLSNLSAIVLAALHGLTGTMPSIQMLIRGDDGFIPGPLLDLQSFRNDVARTTREGVVVL
jgi:hypothetical protein